MLNVHHGGRLRSSSHVKYNTPFRDEKLTTSSSLQRGFLVRVSFGNSICRATLTNCSKSCALRRKVRGERVSLKHDGKIIKEVKVFDN